MSNSEQSRGEVEKMESHYLKVDLRYFFVVVLVLAVLVAALAVWDNKTHILATLTTNLLNFLKVQF